MEAGGEAMQIELRWEQYNITDEDRTNCKGVIIHNVSHYEWSAD